MKRRLVFIAGLLFMLFTNATAQLEIKKTEQKNLSSVYFSKFDNILPNNTHSNKPFKAKDIGTSKALIVAKLPYDAPKIYVSSQNSFYSKTFDTDEDGGGIDFKLAERTSINLGLGCYAGSNNDATDDSCGQ